MNDSLAPASCGQSSERVSGTNSPPLGTDSGREAATQWFLTRNGIKKSMRTQVRPTELSALPVRITLSDLWS